MRRYQAAQIDEYLANGGQKASAWKVAGISLAGTGVFVLPFVLFFLIGQSSPSGDVLKFGELKHEIHYDASNISEDQVKGFGNRLTDLGLFGKNRKLVLHLNQTTTNYNLSFPTQDSAWNNWRVIKSFKRVRDTLQFFYPDKILVINITDRDSNKVRLAIGQGAVFDPNTKP